MPRRRPVSVRKVPVREVPLREAPSARVGDATLCGVKLTLFDVDGTLLSCGGAGMLAMRRAAAALFGGRLSFDGVSPAGSLDIVLFREALLRANAPELEREHGTFRARYLEELERSLEEKRAGVRVYPGVREVLLGVRERDDVVLGMLTGNYGPAAALKLRAAGLEPEWFRVGAFGDEADTRPALVEVALERCRSSLGLRFAALTSSSSETLPSTSPARPPTAVSRWRSAPAATPAQSSRTRAPPSSWTTSPIPRRSTRCSRESPRAHVASRLATWPPACHPGGIRASVRL